MVVLSTTRQSHMNRMVNHMVVLSTTRQSHMNHMVNHMGAVSTTPQSHMNHMVNHMGVVSTTPQSTATTFHQPTGAPERPRLCWNIPFNLPPEHMVYHMGPHGSSGARSGSPLHLAPVRDATGHIPSLGVRGIQTVAATTWAITWIPQDTDPPKPQSNTLGLIT
jgi:hypothetical protein